MKLLTFLSLIFTIICLSRAQPIENIIRCPNGQEWKNNKCGDIQTDIYLFNVPPICEKGQKWVNGKCRDKAWKVLDGFNVITVPPDCEEGYQWINGKCREIWKNVITVRPNCPDGQIWINGQCRDVWGNFSNPSNLRATPLNCPEGQEYSNGMCRQIFNSLLFSKFSSNKAVKETQDIQEEAKNSDTETNIRNIISVPNQCPIGYKPDALGVCRPIFFNYNSQILARHL